MLTALNRRQLAQFAIFAAFAIGGGVAGYAGGRMLKTTHVTPWVLLAVPFIAWLVIAWHELGHLVGGWISGYRTMLFAVGPLKIQRVHGLLRLGFNRSLQLWGGIAASAPVDAQAHSTEATRRAMLRIVAGGPLFSMIGGLLLIPAGGLLDSQPSTAALGAIGAALSIAIGLATLIPSSMGGFKSDGARVLQLLAGGEDARRWANLAVVSGLSMTLRPRDWPLPLLMACTQPGDRSYDGIAAAWLRSTYHEDTGDLEQARFWLEEALAGVENWAKPLRAMVYVNAAYIYAVAGEADLARKHLELARAPGLIEKEQLLHAEAAVLLAEGRHAEAREKARDALSLIPTDAAGSSAAQREQLEAMLQRAAAGVL